MSGPLRLLIVEDNEDDALLIAREFRRAGYELAWERVETPDAMSSALERGEWDAITSDNSMPHFSGPEALKLTRSKGYDIPFLIVSGTMGEEAAVVGMRAGANDYLLKGNLTRLVPALERELREAANRREQRRAALRLHEEQQFQRALLESLNAGIVACNASGQLTLLNHAGAQILGLEGMPLPQPPGSYQLYRADGLTLLEQKELPLVRALRGEHLRNAELVVRPKDAPPRSVLVNAHRILDAEGRTLGAVAAFTDITGLKRAQEELARQREALFQSEKLAAMGQLLAGVAHELNNPLSVVLGQASLLRRALGEHPETGRIDKIARAAERCARIVRNFLALARQRPPERQRVAVGSVIDETMELLNYSLRVDGIEVHLDLERQAPSLWADGHQIQQVLINLLTNAQHALREVPPPRRVTITTRVTPARDRVVIEVSDNGPGIPADLQPRIFESFFTTKAPGEGTGLGLALCKGILEGHGGTLAVESESGRGTLFRLDLPVGAATAGAGEVDAAPAATPVAAHGTSILVVDDEGQVAEMVAELLRGEGHRVQTAADGIEALEKLEHASFDLVVSDLRMPRLDGPGLLREARRDHPALAKRFVFMTGDVLAAGTREFLESTQLPFITKPLASQEVLRAVNQALGAAGSTRQEVQ
jgi:PAS domain S-box-containing protein